MLNNDRHFIPAVSVIAVMPEANQVFMTGRGGESDCTSMPDDGRTSLPVNWEQYWDGYIRQRMSSLDWR